MKFVDELIDKNNSKDPKAFCGILGMFTLCGVTVVYHTDAMCWCLALVIAGALGFALGESINDRIGKKSSPPTDS